MTRYATTISPLEASRRVAPSESGQARAVFGSAQAACLLLGLYTLTSGTPSATPTTASTGTLRGSKQAIADLFSTVRAPLQGYRRMIWTTATLDDGHWDPDPERAREIFVLRQFRKENPEIPLRVMVYDLPMTHYGHFERPKQWSGGMLAAIRWLEHADRP